MLLVRSGPVNRDSGGSVHIWEDNAPVLISYFYDGAAPVEVFQNRSQSGFYMGNAIMAGKFDRTCSRFVMIVDVATSSLVVIIMYEEFSSFF